jgi:ATP-dependent RNA helicase
MASGIDRSKDEKLVFETTNDVQVIPTFDKMNLKEELLRGIYAYSEYLCLSCPTPPQIR